MLLIYFRGVEVQGRRFGTPGHDHDRDYVENDGYEEKETAKERERERNNGDAKGEIRREGEKKGERKYAVR